MKLIRHNVFETNSSSTHSVSIGLGCEKYDTIYPDKHGIIRLSPSEFGWEWEEYSDANSKCEYLWIYARDWAGVQSDEFLRMLKEVVCEHTLADDVVMESYETHWGSECKGYIDHQAVEGSDYHWLFTKDNLKEFIFNPNSILRTGNDNQDCPYDWKEFKNEWDD